MSWKFDKLSSGEVSKCGTFIIYEYEEPIREDREGFEHEYCSGTSNGFRLTNAQYPNITINGSDLYFADRHVWDYSQWCKTFPQMQGKLPAWYVIRIKEECKNSPLGYFWRFCTGFDLISDGRVWCGHIRELVDGNLRITENGTSECYFDNIEDAIKHIDKALDGVEWCFCMEEQQSM